MRHESRRWKASEKQINNKKNKVEENSTLFFLYKKAKKTIQPSSLLDTYRKNSKPTVGNSTAIA